MKKHLFLILCLMCAGLTKPRSLAANGDITGLSVRTGTTTISPILIPAPSAGNVLKFSGNPASPVTAATLGTGDITGLETALGEKLSAASFSAQGSLLVGTGDGTYETLGLGADGRVLMTASTESASGMKWQELGTLSALSAVTENFLSLSDTTTNNASTTKHGLLPKLGGGTANFLRADGSWAAPATFDSTAALTLSANGALSAPPLKLSGTWLTTGGTATTTKPQLLIEPSGTTSTGWSTAGTGLGVNAPSGFSGNLLDLQVNGASKFKVTGSVVNTTSGVLEIEGTAANELKVAQSAAMASGFISMKFSGNKLGLFRSGYDHFLYYDTATGNTVTDAVFGGAKLVFSCQGTQRAQISSAGGLSVGTTTDAGAGNILVTDAKATNVLVNGATDKGGGTGVEAIKNATTVPTTNPTGGGVLYSEGGALKWRGSSGTVTTIAVP